MSYAMAVFGFLKIILLNGKINQTVQHNSNIFFFFVEAFYGLNNTLIHWLGNRCNIGKGKRKQRSFRWERYFDKTLILK